MRQFFLSMLVLLGLTLPLAAQETGLVSLQTGSDRRGWEAVGRLDIAGKGFCTATLIRERLILTAAHCVYDDDNRLIDASRFTFRAGLRNGRAEATRGISALVAHPGYEPDGASAQVDEVSEDIAVLELDSSIRLTRVQPFAVDAQPVAGDQIGVVSYAKDREEVPSLQEVCSVLGKQTGVIIMTCDVDFGASGAPVFMVRNGERKIVSVVSAMAESGGQKISLGTSLDEPLQTLLSHFTSLGPAKPGGLQRIVSIGERNDTGAKFLRP